MSTIIKITIQRAFLMQDKEAYINSIIETLQQNPSYTRHLEYKGKNALMFLDLSNILCRPMTTPSG